MRWLADLILRNRARKLIGLLECALGGPNRPYSGPALDLGSGTGHLGALIAERWNVRVIAADVVDLAVAGEHPIPIADGLLPFRDDAFELVVLSSVLSYPADPERLVREALRVGRTVAIFQSTFSSSGTLRRLRLREFLWTRLGYGVAVLCRYVGSGRGHSLVARRYFDRRGLEELFSRCGASSVRRAGAVGRSHPFGDGVPGEVIHELYILQ